MCLKRAADSDHPRAKMHRKMGRGDILVAYDKDFLLDPCPARVEPPEQGARADHESKNDEG